MADYTVAIFAVDNLINPQNPGHLPSEDATYLSDLSLGDSLTWLGGGESAVVTIVDNVDTVFDEAHSNQALGFPVTFDGVSYGASQIVTPTYTLILSGSDGNTYTLTSFNFSANTNNEEPDAVFWQGAIPPPNTVLTVTGETNPTSGTAIDYTEFVTCFSAVTKIDTSMGILPISQIRVGDRVRTKDGSYKKVCWIGRRKISADEITTNPRLRPVRIMSGALGHGLPVGDLLVSRQHRMLILSKIAKRMLGQQDVLISAIKLTELPGIYVDESVAEIEYFHLLFDKHEIIYAQGAPTESLFTGGDSLKAVSPEARHEILTLFPELVDLTYSPQPAGLIPRDKKQKQLVARHRKNGKPPIHAG